ncbi:MAG: serine hydrolase [Planctomycetota bacterium]
MPRFRLSVFLLLVLVSGLVRNADAQVVAYHNQSAAQHQTQFNTLSAQGYRMISLSIYDDPLNPLFAAVWVHRSGPGWIGFHNVSTTSYASLLSTWVPQGFVPKLLSATGSGSSVRWAGVLEVDARPTHEGHDLSESSFRTRNDSERNQGFRLVMATVYGTSASPQYAGVWRRNDENISWNYSISGSATSYQDHFSAYTSGWLRPIHTTLSSFGRYLSIWYDNQLQNGWTAAHDMTSATYQTTFNSNNSAGRYPICVQAGGVGSAARFAAIFASSETVLGRSFTVTGTAVPELAAFDDYVQQLMQGDAVRAASLAVVKDGRLVLARGYTWAESGYPITQPTSLFRIASASKPLTSIAIHQHMARSRAGIVNDDRTMLSFFPGSTPLDARTNNITLLHLLTHRGGWNINALGWDPVFHDEAINTFYGGTLPVSKVDIFNYMTTQVNLQFTPGNFPEQYSNYGFMMLGRVLESLETSLTYEQIVKRDVFTPLGVTRAQIGWSLLSQVVAGEVRYHAKTPYIATSSLTVSAPWVPGPYGDWNQRNLDANGGWIMATADYAKVLAAFSLGNSNPLLNTNWTDHMWSTVSAGYPDLLRGWWETPVSSNTPGHSLALRHHNGSLPGTATLCAVREDGVGFCLFLNRDHWLGGSPNGVELSDLANQVVTWPNQDLFPSLGIPSIRTHVSGTMTAFGSGCPGSAGTPTHSGLGTPDAGQVMTLRVSNGGASTPVIALIGFSNSIWSGTPLPLSLGLLGAPACSLRVSPDVTFNAATSASGIASINLQLPDQTALIGAHLYSQFVVVAPGANGLGLALSNGLDTSIGGWQ